MPEELFRLRYFSTRSADVLAIAWAYDRPDYVNGDCRVRALPSGAPAARDLTEPMTLAEIRTFVAARPGMLGVQIHDCVGIVLDDRKVDFPDPIEVRSGP